MVEKVKRDLIVRNEFCPNPEFIIKNVPIDKIALNDISKAANNLGYNAQIEKGYRYSRTWWGDPGRVLIDTKGKKKSKVLLEVAKEIRKIQSKT